MFALRRTIPRQLCLAVKKNRPQASAARWLSDSHDDFKPKQKKPIDLGDEAAVQELVATHVKEHPVSTSENLRRGLVFYFSAISLLPFLFSW